MFLLNGRLGRRAKVSMPLPPADQIFLNSIDAIFSTYFAAAEQIFLLSGRPAGIFFFFVAFLQNLKFE